MTSLTFLICEEGEKGVEEPKRSVDRVWREGLSVLSGGVVKREP
jgi:hypothetical protein